MPTEPPAKTLAAPTVDYDFRDNFRRAFWLVGIGWLGSYVAGEIPGFPLQFLLKDELKLSAAALAAFNLFGNIFGYIKPILGIVSDAFPLFGTQRRNYLLIGVGGSAALYVLMGLVPRAFGTLLAVNIALFFFLNVVSTMLGALMVDVGHRHRATGRMSAQRVGLARFSALVTGPVSAWLAKFPFLWAMLAAGGIYTLLIPIVYFGMREPRTATLRTGVLTDALSQLRTLARTRTLWAAAGAVMLVVMAPGFGTPLFFYQTNVLKFSKEFLGVLAFVNAAFSILAAFVYAAACPRLSLRALLAWSIVVHTGGTLFYLFYRSPSSALWITALEGLAQTLAVLPLYDLAARATPRTSAALGYALMMSAWNLTNALANWFGSWLHDRYGLTFMQLVWLNAGTTALVLFIVPFLPASLMRREQETS